MTAALLVIFGWWIFWPVRPRYGTGEPTTHGLWARVGGLIARRPRGVWVVTAILLACASLGLIGFKVAFGVLLDTIIVRSVLVTALNLDVGRHMWWPSQLGRRAAPEVSAEAAPAKAAR